MQVIFWRGTYWFVSFHRIHWGRIPCRHGKQRKNASYYPSLECEIDLASVKISSSRNSVQQKMSFQALFCTIKILQVTWKPLPVIACVTPLYSLHMIFLFCHSVGNSRKMPDTTSLEVRLKPQIFHGIYRQCCN